MKRDKLRRGGAAALALAVLWITAVCGGSGDLRAAVEAIGDTRLVQRLVRWELGDLLRVTDSVSLPALLALEQSPQLLHARWDVQTLPQAANAATEVSAAELPTGTEADAPAEDAVSPARTLVVTREEGYLRIGDVFIKNSSQQAVEDVTFDGTFAAALGDDAPQVLILHTHGSEAYTMPAGQEYESTGSFRTADPTVSVIRVGDAMAAALSQYGISVLHDRVLYDDPVYEGAYYRAEDAIEDYLAKYPSISVILDVHRDALEDKAGHQYKVITREDPDCAQVSLVMGSSWEGWQENLKFAVAVQQHLTDSYPTLMRPITVRNSDYNEYFTPGSLLVEIGAAGNSLDEALAAANRFAVGLAEVLTE